MLTNRRRNRNYLEPIAILVSCLVKKLEDWDAEFRKQHDVVLDVTEQESGAIEQEQKVFDEHNEKVIQLSLRLLLLGLQEIGAGPAPTSDADISKHLGKGYVIFQTTWGPSTAWFLGVALTIALFKYRRKDR